MKNHFRFLSVLLVSVLFFNSCKKEENAVVLGTADYSSDVVISWIDLTLQLTRETPGYSPPVAARVYGYTGLALYEGVRHGMPGYKTLQGQLTDFTDGTIPSIDANAEYHWGAVANSILSTIVKSCFQTTSSDNINLMNNLEVQFTSKFKSESTEEIVTRSANYGKAVAEAIIAFASTDGQTECYKSNFPASYTVPTGPGLWVPTDVNVPIPLQPYWGDVRPFLESNVDDLLPIPPPAYSTDTASEFYKEAVEVYEVVNNLTNEQKTIAEFWSDDPGNTATPPGHSYSIMMQILQEEDANLATSAELYAKLGMAIHDAFISCWNAKYTYNLVRPITFIHEQMDNSWTIPLGTPPFPEYTSGHSVQSGATAQVLTEFLGDNYSFVDKTHVDRTDIDGSPRYFASFYDFAEEAAVSRLYGGIHYRAAIYVGLDQGIDIGKNIGKLKFK